MKKFLVGLAALTMAASAFGAIMSKEEIKGPNSNVKVALPIKLEANVVNGSNRLFIEGTAGDTFGNALVLNFGDIAKGQKEITTDGRVRVFRGDTVTSGNATPTPLGGTVGFKFIIEDKPVDAQVGQMYGVTLKQFTIEANKTPADKIEPTAKLPAGITLTSVSADPKDMPKLNEVSATIQAKTGDTTKNDIKEGRYQGAASLEATLTVAAGVPGGR